MFPHRVLPGLLGLAFLAAQLTGCAGPGTTKASTASTPTPSVTSSNLAGGYLLLGTMPTYFVSSLSNQTNLAVSFSLSGNTIYGSANFQGVCSAGGGFGEGFVGAISGTVNSDGTFTASYSATGNNSQTLTIQGTVPSNAQGSWTGKFTFTSPGAVGTCASSYTGTFTAIPFPNAVGTFSGTGSLTYGAGNNGITVSPGTTYNISTTLAQTPSSFGDMVSGSIQISGFSCFTKGVSGMAGALIASDAESNVLNLNYTMDDGASVQLAATVNNIAGTQIAVQAMYVRGDSCAGNYYFSTTDPQPTMTFLLNQ